MTPVSLEVWNSNLNKLLYVVSNLFLNIEDLINSRLVARKLIGTNLDESISFIYIQRFNNRFGIIRSCICCFTKQQAVGKMP